MKKRKKNLYFLKKYLTDFSNLIKPTKEILDQLLKVRDIFLQTSKKKGKILLIIFEILDR